MTARTNKRRAEPMPHRVTPMLATLIAKPFDRVGWVFEVKWDGFRAIAELDDGSAKLYSRNLKSFAEQYGPIVEAVRSIKHNAVLDGEIVALDKDGISRFQLLQNYRRSGRGQLAYLVFDLLYLDGEDLQSLPL